MGSPRIGGQSFLLSLLQLLLRSEPTPQYPISSNGFSEKLSGLLSSL